MFVLRFFSILLVYILLTPYISTATNYYVDSASGNNSWDGLSATWNGSNGPKKDPWQFNSILSAGDTLYFVAGSYTIPAGSYYLLPTIRPTAHSGTSASPITYKNYNNGSVTLNSSNNTTSGGPIIGTGYTNAANYVVVDGLKINGTATFTFTNNSTLQNCELYNGWDPNPTDYNHNLVWVHATSDLTIQNNYFHDCTGAGGYNVTAITQYNSDNLTVKNNEFKNTTSAMYAKANYRYTRFYKNLIHDLTYGVILYGGSHSADGGHPQCKPLDNDVYQNIFYNCSQIGIFFNVNGYPVTDSSVYNNTIYNCDNGSNENGGVVINTANQCVSNLQMWNNIISNNKFFYSLPYRNSSTDVSYTDYNDFYSSANMYLYGSGSRNISQWQTALGGCPNTGNECNSITSNPSFVNDGSDFNLQSGSPCVNTGIDRQDYDKDGNTTERINMGCYITGNEIIGRTTGSQTTTTTTTGGDTVNPTMNITQPTSGTSYTTDEDTISISGTASDNVGVTSVTWSNNMGGSGNASGTANWSIPNITLHCGDNNNITVRATDAAGNSTIDQLAVDVKPCEPEGLVTQ